MSPEQTAGALDAAQAHEAAGRTGAAERVLLEVLARDPFQVEALNRLAVLVGRAGRVDRAVELLRRAVAAGPLVPHAHYHLGIALYHKGQLGAAAESLGRAIALWPEFADAHAVLGMVHLLVGDYDRGLAEYEWRSGMSGFVAPPPIPVPTWDGSPLGSRTVVLRAEQGFGDTIQFARFAPLVKARHPGCGVVLEVQPALRRLLARFPGTDAVVAVGEPVAADVQVPLMGVMRRLGAAAETIPGPAASPWSVAVPVGGSTSLGPADGRRRLGVVWAGSPTNTNDGYRSMPVGQLAPLLAVGGVRWVSLQVGAEPPPGVANGTAGVVDFADTAAVVAQLDGVVTVDTAVAHLAGSMGLPVWLMVPWLPDWRWGLGRSETPWYPTVRLFRQPAEGAWGPVVAAVARDVGGR